MRASCQVQAEDKSFWIKTSQKIIAFYTITLYLQKGIISPMEPGDLAPDFTLPDLEGTPHALSSYRGRVVVVNFWSAECPWAERADTQLKQWLALGSSPRTGEWGERVVLLTVASNVNETPELIAGAARQRGLAPVLLDSGCLVADAWGAQTTPHVFVVDESGILRYQGAVDDVTFRQREPKRFHLKEAVDALLRGRLPEVASTPAYGCTIVRDV
jgi:peroxiredoxin